MDMPVEISGSAVASFDLQETAASLRAGNEYAANGRSAQTLAKTPDMNVVLTVINGGVALGEHAAPGSVTLAVVEGKIAFISGESERLLGVGSAVVFAADVPHSVRGVEEAAFLLAIARK